MSQVLLAAGAAVDPQDLSCKTPPHEAALLNHHAAVQQLTPHVSSCSACGVSCCKARFSRSKHSPAALATEGVMHGGAVLTGVLQVKR
jgi:ankyrin repeat protein